MVEIELAKALKQDGKLEMAAEYLMRWLQQHKTDSLAWELLGQCMVDMGEHSKAEIAYRRAIASDATRTDLAIPLASSLVAQSRLDTAIEVLQLALTSEPENQDLRIFLGMQLASVDRQQESLDCFASVIHLNPDNHVAWAFKSLSHTRLNEYPQALKDAETSIALNDKFAQAWFAKGRVLQKMGLWQEAADCLEKSLQLNPANSLAFDLLTSIKVTLADDEASAADVILLCQKNLQTSIQHDAYLLRNGYALKEISYFKLKHDVEQAQFMLDIGMVGQAQRQLIQTCMPLVKQGALNRAEKVQLDTQQSSALSAYWLSLISPGLDILSTGCLNRNLDWTAIEQRYLRSSPEIVVIDEFLSPAALLAFQRYNLLTPAWRTEYAQNKYLGAFSNMGYASPLHFQLARDMRELLPAVFKDYRLMGYWGFKYDAVIGKGINVHADYAKVNLNFWVTPNEFNLDPNSGGLKLYDTPCPSDWSFEDYNKSSEKMYEFLSEHKAKSQTVVYQCNRAVLFNSALFHETDTIHFKDSYEGRRVNMTYLFGEQLGV